MPQSPPSPHASSRRVVLVKKNLLLSLPSIFLFVYFIIQNKTNDFGLIHAGGTAFVYALVVHFFGYVIFCVIYALLEEIFNPGSDNLPQVTSIITGVLILALMVVLIDYRENSQRDYIRNCMDDNYKEFIDYNELEHPSTLYNYCLNLMNEQEE